jgi:tryptophan-rich sensory protein
MSELASPGQLRWSFIRWALVTVPTIVVLGSFMGAVSNSGNDNGWYMLLVKPAFQPPGWLFGVAWACLYTMMGIALAMILNARGASGRGVAITVFLVHLFANFGWSPLFFGAHQVTAGFYLLLTILALALLSTWLFWKIRRGAGLLLLPYLGWLVFASALNFETDRLNPDAETLVPPAATTNIR